MTEDSKALGGPRDHMSPSMNTKSLQGSNLLATLHSQMEHMKSAARVCRAAAKKPHSRTKQDISLIMSETSRIPLLTKSGPAVHRDLCHVMQATQLQQMQSLKLPSDFKSAIFIYVVAGSLQVRTKDITGFDKTADVSNKASSNSGNCQSTCSSASLPSVPVTAGATPGVETRVTCSTASAACPANSSTCAATEEELRGLFNSIDADGSGAIDVGELQYALGVMGIQMTAEQVQELMDSVDKDGSGELEFEEFRQILTSKLGQERSAQTTWQKLPDGFWGMQLTHGGCLGEGALTDGAAQKGLLLALEDCSLLVLTATDYQNILINGFDGQLNAKLSVLKRSSTLMSCISSNSDIRGLAYAAGCEQHGWGGHLYTAGQMPQALYVLQEGSCQVVAQVSYRSALGVQAQTVAASAAAPSADGGAGRTVTAAEAAAALVSSPRCGLHSPRQHPRCRRVEVAVLGPGDVAGEAALLGFHLHTSSALVSSAHLTALRLELDDIQALLHPGDLQRLQRLLKQRDEQRQLRCSAAAAASWPAGTQKTALIRPVAAELATDVLADSLNSSMEKTRRPRKEMCGGSAENRLGFDSATEVQLVFESGSPSGSISGRKAWLLSGNGSSVGGSSSQHDVLQLPPTVGGAADVMLSAQGNTPRNQLPSALGQNRVMAAQQLLQHLIAEHEEMKAGIALEVRSAVTALVTSRASRSMPGCQGTVYSTPGRFLSPTSVCSNQQLDSASGAGDQSRAGLTSGGLLSSPKICSRFPKTMRLFAYSSPGMLNSIRSRSHCGNNRSRHCGKAQVSFIGAGTLGSSAAATDAANTVDSFETELQHYSRSGTQAGCRSKPAGSLTGGMRHNLSGSPAEPSVLQQEPSRSQLPPVVVKDTFFLDDIYLEPLEEPLTAAASIAAQTVLSSNSVQLHSTPGRAPRNNCTAQEYATGNSPAAVGTLSAGGGLLLSGGETDDTCKSLNSKVGVIQEGDVGMSCNGCTATGSARQSLTARHSLTQSGVSTVNTLPPCGTTLAGSTTARSVSIGVFCVFEPATWAATQAAAADTSWVMQRQLNQQYSSTPRMQQQQQEETPQAQQEVTEAVGSAFGAAVLSPTRSIKQTGADHAELKLDRLGSNMNPSNPAQCQTYNAAVPLAPAVNSQEQEQVQGSTAIKHKPSRRDWSAEAQVVPRLPLHRLQQQQTSVCRQPQQHGDPLAGCGCDSRAAQPGSASSLSPSPAVYACVSAADCHAGVAGKADGDTLMQHHDDVTDDVTSTPTGYQHIRVTVTRQLSGTDRESGNSSKSLFADRVVSERQHTRQQHQPVQQRPVQQCLAVLPAALPQFTSALTTRWRPKGRFVGAPSPRHGATISLCAGSQE